MKTYRAFARRSAFPARALALAAAACLAAFSFPSASPAQDAAEAARIANGLSAAFQSAAKAIKPSVVSIGAVKKIRMRNRDEGPLGGRERGRGPQGAPWEEFFGEDFFERFFGNPGFGGPGAPFEQRGMGTGFIVAEDGYILTNNHVVDGADEVEVKLADGRTFKAKIAGKDKKTDVAVLKIEAAGLTPAPLGDSDAIEVGQWVIAVGGPFGLDQTVTAGIVSAKGRSGVGITDYEDFIQTDAAINPGNSGGPLVDLNGRVIGVNTAIASRSGGYQGIGFAIPINMANAIRGGLIKDGRVVRGYLGIGIQDLNADLAKSFGFEGTEGILVGSVAKDGPAAGSDLREGDIIVKLDGRPMKNVNQLRNTVAGIAPGTKVSLEYQRDGKSRTVEIALGELPGGDGEPAEAAASGEPAESKLGAVVKTLTPELAKEMGLESTEGAVVTSVQPGGPAQKGGLRPGDVVVKAGDKEIRTAADLSAAVKAADLKEGLRLQVESEKMRRFVFIRAEE